LQGKGQVLTGAVVKRHGHCHEQAALQKPQPAVAGVANEESEGSGATVPNEGETVANAHVGYVGRRGTCSAAVHKMMGVVVVEGTDPPGRAGFAGRPTTCNGSAREVRVTVGVGVEAEGSDESVAVAVLLVEGQGGSWDRRWWTLFM
jgi:hypothetical protein